MEIHFAQRDLSGAQAAVTGAALEVERMEWKAVGGPWAAELRGTAVNLERLWALTDLLRCGVTISDDGGEAWWGYVSAVELHHGSRVMRIDVSEMWNTVRVKYLDDSPEVNGGEEHFSSWTSSAKSVAELGTRAITLEMGKGNAASAAGFAAAYLALNAWPKIDAWVDTTIAGYEEPYALIECKGWWETLDWEYYSQVRGQAGTLEGNATYNFGLSGVAAQRICQTFISAGAAWNATEVWVKLKRYLAADNLALTISADVGMTVILATGTLSGTLVEDEFYWTHWILSAAVSVGSTARWMHIARTGALSLANYFVASVDEGLSYTGGQLVYFNGTTWFNRTPNADLSFLVIGVEDTGTQINDMVEAGQFFTTCRLDSVSSINGRLYRDGTLRIREEVESLLLVGKSTGERLLADVLSNRVVRIYAKPDEETARYVLGPGGEILHGDGRAVKGSEGPAGQWANLGEAAAVGGLMGYESKVWIGGVVWEGGKLRMDRFPK